MHHHSQPRGIVTHPDHTARQRLRDIALARMQTEATTRRVDRELGLSQGHHPRLVCQSWCGCTPHWPTPAGLYATGAYKIHEILIESGHTISHITAVAECSRTVAYADTEKLAAVGYQRSVGLISD